MSYVHPNVLREITREGKETEVRTVQLMTDLPSLLQRYDPHE